VQFCASNTTSGVPPEELTQLEPPACSLSPREATATVWRWHSLLERDSSATTLTRPSGKCLSARSEGLSHPLPHLSPGNNPAGRADLQQASPARTRKDRFPAAVSDADQY